MIKQFRTLIYFEWLTFRSEKSLSIFALVIFISGLYGIYSGNVQIESEQRRIAALDELYSANIAELKIKYPDSADAGDIGYYHAAYAKNIPSNWAKLAIGQRDISPSYLKLRLLAVQNQLYASENTNPYKLSVGSFDLSFVFVFLLPLFIVSICFNVFSQEKEQGTLALLLSVPLRLSTFLLAKFVFRFTIVMFLVVLLSVIGWLWSGIAVDASALVWLLAVALYALFWFSVSFCVISLKRNSAFNAISLLGLWLLFVVLIPVLANMYSEIRNPVSEGLELSLEQREQVHAGWDRPRAKTMEQFFQRYPKFKDTASVEGAFKWKWYFAFQELGDASVEPIFGRYVQKLRNRAELTSQLTILSPAAKLQQAMNGLAATNFGANLDFLLASKKYHDRLKAFYYPFLFEEIPFRHADFDKEPQFIFAAKTDWKEVTKGLRSLAVSTIFVSIIGLLIFRSSKNSLE